MAFKKGKSGNPAGRKTGIPNKTTKEWRVFLSSILDENFSNQDIADCLLNLSPKQRIDVFFRLLDFLLAKPTINEIESDSSTKTSDLMANILANMNKKIPT